MKYVMLLALVMCIGICAARAAEEEKDAGLVSEIFGFDAVLEDFPAIAKDKKPNVVKVDKQVAFETMDDKWPGTEYTDHFYIRWTGVLRVPKDGKYTLYTESDDGSRVFIAGKQVVDNPGLHAMEEKSGEVELKAGDVEIKVEFFENEGGAGCKFSWSAEGLEKQLVPATALFHKKGAEKIETAQAGAKTEEAKTEAKTEAKPEAKTEEAKSEVKSEAKTEAKTEAKSQ
ncbi:MAG: hypothetical protein HY291_18970 [Planctomycetes bacterium]|nr:hypothetical protein [Planctomycetota bacterium]